MLVRKAQEAQGSPSQRKPGPDRLVTATKQVVRVATPSNLDDDLPGRRVAHGFNIGLTPVLFAAIGYGLDKLVGTLPVFTIAFTVLSVVGLLARFYYSYVATIAAEEQASRDRMAKRGRHAGGQGSRG